MMLPRDESLVNLRLMSQALRINTPGGRATSKPTKPLDAHAIQEGRIALEVSRKFGLAVGGCAKSQNQILVRVKNLLTVVFCRCPISSEPRGLGVLVGGRLLIAGG
jgi:hypothetical protein